MLSNIRTPNFTSGEQLTPALTSNGPTTSSTFRVSKRSLFLDLQLEEWLSICGINILKTWFPILKKSMQWHSRVSSTILSSQPLQINNFKLYCIWEISIILWYPTFRTKTRTLFRFWCSSQTLMKGLPTKSVQNYWQRKKCGNAFLFSSVIPP